MSDAGEILKTVVSGLITGGTSAATTFLTVFRAMRNRVTDLEEKLGSSTEPKSGLFLVVAGLEDSLRRLKRDIDAWEDQPPDWAKRMVNRAKANASSDLNTVVDIESRVDARLRSFHERLTSIESNHGQTSLLSREEYLEDSTRRAREVGEIREEVAAVNGLLKGILVALGKDPDSK